MTLFVHRTRATRRRFATLPVVATIGSLAALLFASNALAATTVPLGNAASFGALSSTAMTNAGGLTVVDGDIGSSTSIDAGVTNGTHGSKYLAGSTQLANAQASLLTAYGAAAAATPDHPTITGANLAGKTLTAGVYNSTSSILVSGPVALTLDGNGDPNSVFIFQAGSTLTVDPTSSVVLTNGAQACNVFWQVGSSAFLKNSGNVFTGTILALTQITLTDGITVNGRALARNADVTFIHDTVNTPTCASGGLAPGNTPSRSLYCDPAGKAWDLLTGEDKLAPYDKLNLVPAYVDPVTGSKSCNFPVAVVTPPVVPPPIPVPPKPAPSPTPAQKAAKAAAVKAAAKKLATAKAAKAKKVGSARPAVRRRGFTG